MSSNKKSAQGRIKLRGKHLLSLLVCVGIMIVFCALLNGRLGIYCTLMLVISLVFSLFLTFKAGRQVEISFVSRNEMINKGDIVEISFAVSKRTWLPTPFIEISLDADGNLEPVTPATFRIAMGFSKNARSYSVKYRAKYCGSGAIGVKTPMIIDYLGVFTATVERLKISGDGVCRFGIIPIVHEINSDNELLRICCDATAYDDNSEETDETAPIGNGTAGYEHREYEPGDPIKRINWKLSSKRDTLMIRLDEKMAAASQVIVFELSGDSKDSDDFYQACDLTAEATLSMAALMLRQGLSCKVYCHSDVWECFDISDETGLAEYQAWLACCGVVDENDASLPEELKEGGHSVIMYFTNHCESLAQRASQLGECGSDVYTVVAENLSERCTAENSYSVSKEFDFVRIR